MEGIQIEPMEEANIELQMTGEEFIEFMKNPIRKEKVAISDILYPDLTKQAHKLPKVPRYDKCIPDMISQEEVKI